MNTKSLFRQQLRYLLSRPAVLGVFLFTMAVMLTDFLTNVLQYRGTDIIEMVHPARLLLLDEYSTCGYWFLTFFPILCILPAGDLYFTEQHCGMETILRSRYPARGYYGSILIASFMVTFLVFAVPLLLQIPLNLLAFPTKAAGEQGNWDIYSEAFRISSSCCLFPKLAVGHPWWNALFGIVLLSGCGSLAAALTEAFTMAVRIPIRAALFLPSFLIFYGVTYLYNMTGPEVKQFFIYYFRLFNTVKKSTPGFFLLIGLIALLSGFLFGKCSRKDVL